jgi:nitroimidazol reductase NimA-like FMN-containing flavoprotein (pyridoxamine 5'-phosphate oxidase superfamily)
MQVRNVDVAAARRMFAGLPVASVATLNPDGSPHVVPLWFVWLEDAVYVSARRPGRTWTNASADPRVALTIDLGRAWVEIAGVEIRGRAELIAAVHPDMRTAMSAWHEKYRSLLTGDGFSRFTGEVPDIGFLRVGLEHVAAWDHARD